MKEVSVKLDTRQLRQLDDCKLLTNETGSTVMRQALSLYHRLVRESHGEMRFIVRDGDDEKEVWII